MKKNDCINNNNFQFHNFEKKKLKEKININHSQLEKDIFILINYIRTNPLEFSKNFQNKENEERSEVINFLQDIYNKEMLVPFEEIPEISAAARNLLINIALNDKKYHNLNLKNIKPETLNLRTRLSNYGHRTGRIFETVVFKTDNPEDIVNHIIIDEKGRNMLLSNKMKYIGVACDILPSNIICSVIDIVQDFIPYKNDSEIYHNTKVEKNYEKYDNYNNYNNYGLKGQYYINKNNNEYPRSSINDYNYDNYDNNIDNLKLKLDIREKDINENNNPNMNIIINNNNEDYMSNLYLNKHNQRKNNIYIHNNEYYKTPKKMGSMDISVDKKNFFSPKSINSYNIIINNKIIPRKNNSNNINLIKKSVNGNNTTNNNKINDDDKNIFTMAGRTCKEQQEVIEISSKMNLNKSKSVCSFDFNLNNSKLNNKNKFQRLNPKEKLEILHKINQRNKNPKSLSINNKELEKLKNTNNGLNKKNSYNLDNIDDNKKNISSYFINNGDYNLNFDFDKNNEYINTNRVNTCVSKMNDSSNLANFCRSPSYNETKSNFEFNEEYSKHKINEIKNDLLIFKNQIKRELKDEVKNEIKAEIKNEISINQNKKKPNSIKVEQDYEINNMINNKRKMNKDDNTQNNNKINLIDDEIYYKKNNSNYFIKNKVRNRCSSEEKFIYAKNNINIPLNNNDKERRSFNPQIYAKNSVIENNMKDKYRKSYEQLNDMPNNISNNNINHSVNQYNMNKNISNDLKMNLHYNDGHKAKNRQQIKKLIRLYNMAKDSKRNQSKFINDNMYDIINNNKSISNICFDSNNKNNTNNNNENMDNIEKDNNNIKNNKNENIFNKGYIFQKKYERVKPKGNFYKYIKSNSNKNSVSSNTNIQNIEDKNKINDYNKNEKNEYLSIKEDNKEKENIKKRMNNYNSMNDIIPTGKFIEENNNTNKNLNDNMSIKSYADKNMIYKKERRKERNPSAIISNAEKKDIINIIKNNIDNEGKYFENYNLKTPNQTQKIKQYEINNYDKRPNILINSNNNTSKASSFYNDNTPYQCFPLNYKNINNQEQINNKDDNKI